MNARACPALADLRVRQALSCAVDRQAIADQLHGGVLPWHHFVAAGVAGDLFQGAAAAPAFQPDRARRLWQEARGGAPLHLRILFADYYPNREILCALRARWTETLDVTVELEAVGFAEHTRRLNGAEFAVALALLSPSYSHPSAFLRYFVPDLEPPWAEALVQHLIRAQETAGKRSRAVLRAADALLRQAMPAIPLCNGQSIFLQRPEIQGYRLFPDGSASFRGLRLAAE